MKANGAVLTENHDKVIHDMLKYEKEFESRGLDKFGLGSSVIVRNGGRSSKMNRFFDRTGDVVNCEPNSEYGVL